MSANAEQLPESTIFALPIVLQQMYPNIDQAMKDKCFGSCGKVSLGGLIDIEPLGACWVCTESECPYMVKESEIMGTSGITGDAVKIRLMGEVKNDA